MQSPIRHVALGLLVAAVLLALGLSVLRLNLGSRGRAERGVSPDRSSLRVALGRFGPLVSQVPAEARAIRYFFFFDGTAIEFRFQMNESDFLSWIKDLGWSREAAFVYRGSGSALVYDTDEEAGFKLIEFKNGFELVSLGPGNRICRTIAYDEDSQTVYVRLSWPLPSVLHNGV